MRITYQSFLKLGAAVATLACMTLVQTRAASAATPQDQQFVTKAWNINMGEVQLGRLAEQRASSPAVKSFAKQMVSHHAKLNSDLATVAQSAEAKLPESLDREHQRAYDRLSKLSGEEFDRQYMEEMIKGHTKAISLFERKSTTEQQTPVSEWARQNVGQLRQHLVMAEATGQLVGAPSARRQQQGQQGRMQQGSQGSQRAQRPQSEAQESPTPPRGSQTEPSSR